MGNEVSEAQLQLLVGMGHDSVTGVLLGFALPVYKTVAERIKPRTDSFDPALDRVARADAVAGFDFTFSIPKSASMLCVVADAGVQALIEETHHAAVAEAVAFMDREVAATRTGATVSDGTVVQRDVTWMIATVFEHFDSRSADPHLHMHVVISNKAKTVLDGKW